MYAPALAVPDCLPLMGRLPPLGDQSSRGENTVWQSVRKETRPQVPEETSRKGRAPQNPVLDEPLGMGQGGVAAQTLRERGQLRRARGRRCGAREALGRLGGFRGLSARQLQFALLLEGAGARPPLFTLAAGLL